MSPGKETEKADRCQACGKQFGADDRFCGACGAVRLAPQTLVLEAPGNGTTGPSDAPVSRSAIIGIAAGVLVVGAIVAGILLAMSGGSKHTAQRASRPLAADGGSTGMPSSVSPSSTTGEEESSSNSSSTATQGESAVNTAPSTAASSQVPAPLGAVNKYWADIGAHNFAGAYGYLAPVSIALNKSQFVVSEREAGIRSVQFHGEVESDLGSSATVEVVSLVTHDASFGCRTWTGSYEMSMTGGAWHITRANLSPESCSG